MTGLKTGTDMEAFNLLFEKYKSLNYALSLEDEREKVDQYVYSTNKLEGNKLSLAQTTSLLHDGVVSGENISVHDILEHKGIYKAVVRMLNAVAQKQSLSLDLMIEINWLALGSLWKDESSYLAAKEAGQKENSFKTVNNIIRVKKPNKTFLNIAPLSSPENVYENMGKLIDVVNSSTKSCIEKAAFLSQEIWLHQPFFDGNKRTGRLLINFLTMKEGFPFFVFEDKSLNYNNLLVKQYIEEKPGLVEAYIRERLIEEMTSRLNMVQKAQQNRSKGYRFVL
jgi:Fic family protein